MKVKHKISKTKEFKDFKGTLKLELVENSPAIIFTADISPAMHPQGLKGWTISQTRNYGTKAEAELEFAEFKERYVRSRIEYMMLCAEQMEEIEDKDGYELDHESGVYTCAECADEVAGNSSKGSNFAEYVGGW